MVRFRGFGVGVGCRLEGLSDGGLQGRVSIKSLQQVRMLLPF